MWSPHPKAYNIGADTIFISFYFGDCKIIRPAFFNVFGLGEGGNFHHPDPDPEVSGRD